MSESQPPPPPTDPDPPLAAAPVSPGPRLEDLEGREELSNPFSWSKSRHEVFTGCRRRYYLQYYAYWGGWAEEAPPRQRRLYVLRRLSSKEQWSGIAVHEAVARSLERIRRGRPIPLDELVEATRQRMRGEYRNSLHKRYWHQRRGFGLIEHEYDDPVPREAWKASWDLVERCLRGLSALPLWQRLLAEDQGGWKPIDRLDSFELEGVEVWAAPDFARVDASGRLEIVDWKTGTPRPSDALQLAAYAAFAVEKWGASPDRILGRLAYLSTGVEEEVSLDPAAIEGFRAECRGSIQEMRAVLVPGRENEAIAEEAFPKTEERWRCPGCAFRGECYPGVRVPSPDPLGAGPSV